MEKENFYKESEKSKINKEKNKIVDKTKTENEKLKKEIENLNILDNNFKKMEGLLALKAKDFNIEVFRENLSFFKEILEKEKDLINKYPEKQKEFEKRINNLEEFNNMYIFLENKKEETLITKDQNTKKEILLIGQMHSLKSLEENFIEKVRKSQKLIYIYMKYFQKDLNHIGLENTSGNKKKVLDTSGNYINEILNYNIGRLFLDSGFINTKGEINNQNIIDEIKIRNENNHKSKERYMLGSKLDGFSIEDDYLFSIIEEKTKRNIEDLLFYSGFTALLSMTEENKEIIGLENEFDPDIKERDNDINKLLEHILEKYPKEDETLEVFNYFSNNIYKIFGKGIEKEIEIFIDNFLNKYHKLNKNKVNEITKSIFYYGYTKREDYILENIEKNFSKEKETIPLVYGSSHIKTFEERIKVWNKKNPDKKYSYKVIDLSKF